MYQQLESAWQEHNWRLFSGPSPQRKGVLKSQMIGRKIILIPFSLITSTCEWHVLARKGNKWELKRDALLSPWLVGKRTENDWITIHISKEIRNCVFSIWSFFPFSFPFPFSSPFPFQEKLSSRENYCSVVFLESWNNREIPSI